MVSERKDSCILDAFALASPWLVSYQKDSEFTERDFYFTYEADSLVHKYSSKLQEQPRWKVFGLDIDHPDFTVYLHTHVRQTPIVAQALKCDAEHFNFGRREIDLMLAASFIHDLGEAATGDITYDLKTGNRRSFDLAEASAVMKMIDSSTILKQQFKEIYLRITTSLETQDINDLLKKPSVIKGKINWEQLRNNFELYERYGYLITAFQIFWPLTVNGYPRELTKGYSCELTDNEKETVVKWNRKELEAALNQGQEISEAVKWAILTKNVLLNQWPHIIKAAQAGIPSTRYLFDNSTTINFIAHANYLLSLNLEDLTS